jgi:ribonucleoside-diphosphate reductase alpha chain
LKVLADKFSHTRFEPSGFTGNPQIPIAKSITDYIFRWLELKFGGREHSVEAQPVKVETSTGSTSREKANGEAKLLKAATGREAFLNQADAPPCHTCGAIMVRSGACYKCANCGATSGCS